MVARRPGGRARILDALLRVRTVVLLVAALPLVATAALGVVLTRDRQAVLDGARRAQDDVEVVAALAALQNAVLQEQTLSAGLAVAVDLGLDPAVVDEVLGGDLTESLDAARLEVTDAAQRWRAATLARHDRGRSGQLEEGLVLLSRLRPRLDAVAVGTQQVASVFVPLRAAISSALSGEYGVLGTHVADTSAGVGLERLVATAADLARLVEIAASEIGHLSSWLLPVPIDGRSGVVDRDGDRTRAHDALIGAATSRADYVRRVSAGLEEALAVRWTAVRDSEAARSFERAIEQALGVRQPELTAEEAPLVLRAGTQRLQAIGRFLGPVLAAARDAAHAEEVRAQRDVTMTRVFVVVVAAATLIVTLLGASAVSRPLRRLERRSRRVRHGELEFPHERRGLLTEPRLVGDVLDEIVENLRVVEAQAMALADGRLDDPSLGAFVPGAVGASLRGSVGRLSTLTQELRASEALARAIVADAADAIFVLDADGLIAEANGAAGELVGVDAAELDGRPFVELLVDVPADLAVGLGRLRSYEACLAGADGERRPVLLSSSVTRDDGAVTVLAHDIAERKRFEARLAAQARSDTLTGLANRLAAVEAISEGIARIGRGGGGVAVVFCDLDGFKQVNDAHGHGFGDELLRAVAQRLASVVRGDETLARLGGDEFVVVATGLPRPEPSLRLASRLRDALSFPLEVDGQLLSMSASFGIAWTSAAADPLDLLRDADIAMYRAKATCTPVRFFDEELESEMARRSEVERALGRALVRDELELHYQPVVDVASGRPVALEALVRWHRPGCGLVRPDEFVPVAEETGLIVDLDRWVLRAAARQAAAWSGHGGPDLPIALNIAGRHLLRHDLVRDVTEACADAGVSTDRVRIELTETQLVHDAERVVDVLTRLRSLGVRVLVDDFGTGYASITYLRRLPVDGVKIDRSLVSGPGGRTSSAIVQAICRLADALALDVIAEGIETDEQRLEVLGHGCRLGQGYLWSPPRPADELVDWLDGAHTWRMVIPPSTTSTAPLM